MENTEKERLTTLKEQWQQASQERNSLEGKAQELQISITQKFEQFIGKKHLNEEDLHRMIQFLQEGQCKSLYRGGFKSWKRRKWNRYLLLPAKVILNKRIV